jgi:hypothetical protein
MRLIIRARHCHVPRRLRRHSRRPLLRASSLVAPLPPSPVFQPRLPVRLAPPPTPLSSPPRSTTFPRGLRYCHRHHLHGELLMCGARPRLRGVLKALPPPRVRLAVPRVAHMAEEPVVARRPRLMKAEEDDGGATQRTSDQRPKPVTQDLITSKVYCVLINHIKFLITHRSSRLCVCSCQLQAPPSPPSSQQPCAARAQTSRDHAYSPRGPKK